VAAASARAEAHSAANSATIATANSTVLEAEVAADSEARHALREAVALREALLARRHADLAVLRAETASIPTTIPTRAISTSSPMTISAPIPTTTANRDPAEDAAVDAAEAVAVDRPRAAAETTVATTLTTSTIALGALREADATVAGVLAVEVRLRRAEGVDPHRATLTRTLMTTTRTLYRAAAPRAAEGVDAEIAAAVAEAVAPPKLDVDVEAPAEAGVAGVPGAMTIATSLASSDGNVISRGGAMRSASTAMTLTTSHAADAERAVRIVAVEAANRNARKSVGASVSVSNSNASASRTVAVAEAAVEDVAGRNRAPREAVEVEVHAEVPAADAKAERAATTISTWSLRRGDAMRSAPTHNEAKAGRNRAEAVEAAVGAAAATTWTYPHGPSASARRTR